MPCGQGPSGPEGAEEKLVWLESQSIKESGMRKGLREAGARSCRLVCVLRAVRKVRASFKLLQTSCGEVPRFRRQDEGTSLSLHRVWSTPRRWSKSVTSPGLKLREKQVFSKEHDPNERGSEGRERMEHVEKRKYPIIYVKSALGS